jgi:hypothetical protein
MNGEGLARAINIFPSRRHPWPLLLLGFCFAALSWVWLAFLADHAGPPRAILLFVGMMATVAGVGLDTASWKAWLTASVTGLIATAAINPEWDSARLFVFVLAGFAAFAAVLAAVPPVLRRVLISLVILFHFGGIATAVQTVPPTPWLVSVLWTHMYRYYLEFIYVTNAYHFYSPEPGPATLLWGYVKYEDGTGRWFETPRRDAHAMAVEYQRRLSLTESTNQQMEADARVVQELRYRRILAAQADGIPLHPALPESMQYREPTTYSKHMLETYSRYIAGSLPHPTNPSCRVTGVKLYRVVHRVLNPGELARDIRPDDPSTYFAYYQGEFDPEGHLKNPTDPLLYWLIPMLGKDDADGGMDYVQLHAQQKN